MYASRLPLWMKIRASWEVSRRTASLTSRCVQVPLLNEHQTFAPHVDSPNLKRTIQLKTGEVYNTFTSTQIYAMLVQSTHHEKIPTFVTLKTTEMIPNMHPIFSMTSIHMEQQMKQ
jgi:hypothetical protein